MKSFIKKDGKIIELGEVKDLEIDAPEVTKAISNGLTGSDRVLEATRGEIIPTEEGQRQLDIVIKEVRGIKKFTAKPPQCAYCNSRSIARCDKCWAAGRQMPMCARCAAKEGPFHACREHREKKVGIAI